MPSKILQCFDPFVDKKSKILILGTMPGPTALAKQEYYGFPGNHFWKILTQYFGITKPLKYEEKVDLLRRKKIALWDVFGSCEREGAADNAIQKAELNPIPELLNQYPNIQAVFLNGRTAEKIFRSKFSSVKIPSYYLPSTSPAHAGLSYEKKYQLWSQALSRFLKSK